MTGSSAFQATHGIRCVLAWCPDSVACCGGRTVTSSLNRQKDVAMSMVYDVVVVGAGNAAMCAVHAARERGCSVLVLERAPCAERGGNTGYTAGAIRTVYRGVEDLRQLMPDLTDDEVAMSDFGSYSEADYLDDMARTTQDRCHPELVEVMVRHIWPTLLWLREKGVRFAPIWGRQAVKVDGRFRFRGGLTVEVAGGGPGLVEAHHRIAQQTGVEVLYSATAIGLVMDDHGVRGVRYRHGGKTQAVNARSVVLSTGGFQSNLEWRTRYLGPNWDLAKVRGTRFNTGLGHEMAIAAGAQTVGHWSGCHAVCWERHAPPAGDPTIGDGFQKLSYTLGIMVNAHGRRFVDEGADFHTYTYSRYGAAILAQPGQFAWQVFDQKTSPMLRDEYRIRQSTRVQADTLEELASKLDGVDRAGFLDEVSRWNEAVVDERAFDYSVRDGRTTRGLKIPKSNWAHRLDQPPFVAYAVTCGITFTYGGIKISPQAEVLDVDDRPIPGLFAAGELVGDIFYFGYPGGSGLASGAVFGRIAGLSASSFRSCGNYEAVSKSNLTDSFDRIPSRGVTPQPGQAEMHAVLSAAQQAGEQGQYR
jgi:tricarballylate dehydrogenase